MPDIEDIAKEAGVSVTTVRRVLRGGNKETWPSAIRRGEKIRQVAAELGYQSNWCAASLARRSTRTIGLVHHQVVPVPTDQWLGIMQELTDALHEKGYDLQFVAGGSQRAPQMLMDGRFDGCIVVHRLRSEIADALERSELPVVLLNSRDSDRYPSVINNDELGAKTLTRHLIELGHRRIAFAHRPNEVPEHFSVADRYNGVCEAMREAGIDRPAMDLAGDEQEIVKQILAAQDRPTAVVTYDDDVALPLLHACWVQGIRVPQDLSVATFNDTRQTRTSIPPLTTMAVPVVDAARHSAQLILELLEKPGDIKAKGRQSVVRLDEQLIVRSSTARPAISL